MTIEEIQQNLKEAFDSLSEIDNSEAFAEMLDDSSFVIGEGDMSYLVHQLESMFYNVKAYVGKKKNEG